MVSPLIQSNLSIGVQNPIEPPPSGGILNPYAPISVPPTDAINYSIRKTTTIDRLQYPLERPKFYMKIQIASYHRFDGQGGNLFSVARLEDGEVLYLPLPQQMIDINQVTYDQRELGQLAGGVAQVAASAANMVRGNEAASGGQVNNIGATLGGIASAAASTAAAVIQAKTRDVLPVRDLANAGLSIAGYTPNQFITILLRGPAYKRHTFTWLFSPRNERELQNLIEIFNVINNAKSPGLTAGGTLFTFPKVFRCSFMPNSKYLYKFKPAVVESFTIDPTGGGAPAFFRPNSNDGLNGAAVYQVRLDLLELEYWLSGNYSLTNDPYDTQGGQNQLPSDVPAAYDPIQNPNGGVNINGVSTEPGVIHQQGSFF